MTTAPKLRWRDFSTWLLVLAWLLYVCSLFVPCAMIQNPDGPPGQGLAWDGTRQILPGYQLLELVFFPIDWLFIVPAIYCLVNLVFFATPLPFIFRIPRKVTLALGVMTWLAALAAWLAPLLLMKVFLGYFFWTSSITLAAAALLEGPMSRPKAP